ncbi:RsmB/NOP family class I SAM-dependent RNA methyltransferase [Oleiharenicola sp. Vm1]|uniref:RsmB/NOP family class I SAM-dependent RNA methyltransferase n=1 Tax=Oleiharenicola sp. Vm1 TaxID=3398393 RepID=UPI0039F4CC18
MLLAERWLATQARVDTLLEQLTPGLPAQERARAQHLFYGVVRWADRLDAALAGLMARAPRTKVRAVLFVAGFELLEPGAEPAKIVHHAVEKAKRVASAKEAGLINAVARKLAARLAQAPATVAEAYAHPAWLVARWEKQFGTDATRQLLEWNQQPAPVYARWRSAEAPPEFLTPTKWPAYFEVKAGHWDEIRDLARKGALYLQDPSTRLCIELLAPAANETILDACAAPGGKSLFMADVMRTGRIVALDLPAAEGERDVRFERLKENLTRVPSGVEVALMPGDLRQAGPRFFKEFNLPESYDAVLLDAPCSNTGVMRHRIDVKWRLQEGDFAKHAAQQLALLRAAARLVREGGRLVYSTCSIDPAENEEVVQRFLKDARTPWTLERHILAYPWADGHDGAGAFLLRRG